MKTTRLLNALMCSLFLFTFAFGQRMERPNAGPWNGRLLEKLNLTDAQKQDFQKLNTDFAKQRVEQQSKIKLAAIDLRSLMKADSPDKAAIEKQIRAISDLQAGNRMLRVDHWFAVNKILNPDQQKIWKELLDHPLRTGFRGGRMCSMREGRMMQPRGRTMPQGNTGK